MKGTTGLSAHLVSHLRKSLESVTPSQITRSKLDHGPFDATSCLVPPLFPPSLIRQQLGGRKGVPGQSPQQIKSYVSGRASLGVLEVGGGVATESITQAERTHIDLWDFF